MNKIDVRYIISDCAISAYSFWKRKIGSRINFLHCTPVEFFHVTVRFHSLYLASMLYQLNNLVSFLQVNTNINSIRYEFLSALYLSPQLPYQTLNQFLNASTLSSSLYLSTHTHIIRLLCNIHCEIWKFGSKEKCSRVKYYPHLPVPVSIYIHFQADL